MTIGPLCIALLAFIPEEVKGRIFSVVCDQASELFDHHRNHHLESCVEDAYRRSLLFLDHHTSDEQERRGYQRLYDFRDSVSTDREDFPPAVIRAMLQGNPEVLAASIEPFVRGKLGDNPAQEQIRTYLSRVWLYQFGDLLKRKQNTKAWIAFQRECWWDLRRHIAELQEAVPENFFKGEPYQQAMADLLGEFAKQLRLENDAQTETLLKAINAAHCPPRILPRQAQESANLRQALSYRAAITDYIWPDRILEQLLQFEQTGRQPDVRWTLLLAPAGSGKSRLGMEELDRLSGHGRFDTIFLDSSSAYSSWHLWQPVADTLIVIDYAYREREKAKTAIRSLVDRTKDGATDPLQHSVRILLLERDKLGIFLESELSNLEGRWQPRAPGTSGRDLSHLLAASQTKALELPDLSLEQRARLIEQSFRTLGGEEHLDFAAEAGRLVDQRLGTPLGALLWGYLLANWARYQTPLPTVSAEAVLEAVLAAEWEKLKGQASQTEDALLVTFGTAAASGGAVRRPDLAQMPEIQGHGLSTHRLSDPALNTLFASGYSLFAQVNGEELAPGAPDFLAEAIVVGILQDQFCPEGSPQLGATLRAYFSTAQDRETFVDLILRAVQNFPGAYSQLAALFPEGSEEQWVTRTLDFVGRDYDLNEAERLTAMAKLQPRTSAFWMLALMDCVGKGRPGAFELAKQLWTSVRERSDLPEAVLPAFRRGFVGAAYNAIEPDMAPNVRLGLVGQIRDLWRESQDPEIRLRYAKAAYNAIQPDMTPEVRLDLVGQIRDLWRESQDPEIRLEYAKAAVNAIQPDMTPEARLDLVGQIRDLWRESQDPEIRLAYAKAAFNAIQPDMTPEVRLDLVGQIRNLWIESQAPEIQLTYAMATGRAMMFALEDGALTDELLGLFAELLPVVDAHHADP